VSQKKSSLRISIADTESGMTDTTGLDAPGTTSSCGGVTVAGTRRPSSSSTTVTVSVRQPLDQDTKLTGQFRTLGVPVGESKVLSDMP